MKQVRYGISLIAVFVFILSGCNMPGATPVPTEAPTEVQTSVPVEATPSETATAVLVEVPIDLAGPPMEVGSKYLYVDGSVIVAVPGGPFLMGNNNIAQTLTKTLKDYVVINNNDLTILARIPQTVNSRQEFESNIINTLNQNRSIQQLSYIETPQQLLEVLQNDLRSYHLEILRDETKNQEASQTLYANDRMNLLKLDSILQKYFDY